MKVLQLLTIFFGILTIGYAANASWGSLTSNSVLANTQTVVIRGASTQYQSSVIYFPVSGTTNTRNITYINVIDRFTNSSGPTSTLWSGGPGYTFTSINLRSQYSQGINVTAQFYVN